MLTGNAPASYNIVLLLPVSSRGLPCFSAVSAQCFTFLLYTNFPYFLTHFSKCDTIKQVKREESALCITYAMRCCTASSLPLVQPSAAF